MVRRIGLLAAVVLLGSTWARSAPPQTEVTAPSPPPSPASGREATADAKPAPREPEMKKVAYLGLATTQTLPQTRAALGLPEGVGLTVQDVLSGSPAESAGLKRNDVIHKINNQVLVNNPQFHVLVRTFKPGDEIELAVFRDGVEKPIQVRLAEKTVPALKDAGGRYYWTLRNVHGKVDIVAVPATFSARYEDEKYELELTTSADGRRLRAKSKKDGRLLFHGPVDTPAERKAVPEMLREPLEFLETPPAAKSPSPALEPAIPPASE